jgi:MFS family permease
MWQAENQQYAISFVVLSSVAGSLVGPIFGGFIETYLSFRWVFWVQLIFGVVAQAVHFFVAKETNTDILLDREARRRRNDDVYIAHHQRNVWGPLEIKGTFGQRISWRHIGTLMWRPYCLLLTEPIVGFLSLLSGFSDALIFTGLSSFPLVLKKWNFSTINIGLAFIGLLVGYILAYLGYLLHYWRDDKRKAASVRGPSLFTPERRLYLLLFLVLLEPIGLLGFAFSSFGPPHVHWIAPILFTIPIGIANYAIYQATVDYMVAGESHSLIFVRASLMFSFAAYGPYSASATGGNGFCRDALAGFAALYAAPMYSNIAPGTKWQLTAPSLILAGIGAALCVPVFVFFFFGEWFRKNSKFAQNLEEKRQDDLNTVTDTKVDGARDAAGHDEVVGGGSDPGMRSTEV